MMNIKICTIDNDTYNIEIYIYQNCNQELQFVINFADCNYTVITGCNCNYNYKL